MNLYLKRKVFSIKEKFNVYDENENVLFTGSGKIVSIHDYHYIYNTAGQEVANIHKKVLALMPKFFIEYPAGQTHEMKGKLALAHDVFEIKDLDWKITGKFLQHDYKITECDREIVSMHQKWLAWGDTYEIVIADGVDVIMALATILCIDVFHEEEAEMDSALDSSSGN